MRHNYPQMQAWIGMSEGGYVNNPKDPGGATDRGITQRTYDAWNDRLGKSRRPVRGISKAEAERIIESQYFDTVRADKLPSGLDYAVADYSVNSGPRRAAMDLQRSLGMTGKAVDGIVGNHTLAAAAKADVAKVIVNLCNRRMSFLKRLSHWRYFKNGWTARVMGNVPGVQTDDIGVIDRAVRLSRENGAKIPAPRFSVPGKAFEGGESLLTLLLNLIQSFFEQVTSKGRTS